MEIYEDIHVKEVREHYHLGGSEHSTPNNQHLIYREIIELIKKVLPNHLHLRFNNGNYHSVNIEDDGNRTYIFLNCYYYRNENWRVKITPFERGKEFFESFFKPLIKSIKDVI